MEAFGSSRKLNVPTPGHGIRDVPRSNFGKIGEAEADGWPTKFTNMPGDTPGSGGRLVFSNHRRYARPPFAPGFGFFFSIVISTLNSWPKRACIGLLQG